VSPRPAAPPANLAAAEKLCRRIARRHYENFLVGTIFLPRRYRQPFYNIYAYCRTADDLADESPSPEVALQRLDAWQAELDACFAGQPQHPILVALAETIRQFELPQQPFADLLDAFRQDQRKPHYESFEEVLDYCRRSADPVGRILLGLAAQDDPQQLAWSDAICTGLQLANFWQDLHRDWERGRCYIPREDFRAFARAPEDLPQLAEDERLRDLVRFQVERAAGFFTRGLPLVDHVPHWLARDLRLFIAGGQEVLTAIERQQYDVWSRRPVVSKRKQVGFVLRVALGKSL